MSTIRIVQLDKVLDVFVGAMPRLCDWATLFCSDRCSRSNSSILNSWGGSIASLEVKLAQRYLSHGTTAEMVYKSKVLSSLVPKVIFTACCDDRLNGSPCAALTDFTCTHKEWTDTLVDTTLPIGFQWAVSTMVPTGLESFPLWSSRPPSKRSFATHSLNSSTEHDQVPGETRLLRNAWEADDKWQAQYKQNQLLRNDHHT